MARIFTSGAEENNTTNNGPVWTATSGTPSVVTSPVYSGTYAYRALRSTSGTTIFQRNLTSAVTSGTYYVRFRFRIASLPASNCDIHQVRSGASADAWTVICSTGGEITLVNVADAGTITGPTLSTDTWYRIETAVAISDTVGTLELKVDGTSYGTISSKDTLPTNIQQFQFGVLTSTTADFYIDDIAINDDSGSFQNDYPGNFKVALVVPGSDVTNDWEDETSGSSTFDNIDNIVAGVDDANYNEEAATLNSVDRFGITTIPAEVTSDATMSLFHVAARIGSNQTSAASGNLRVWDEGGSSSDGDTFSCNSNGWKAANTAGGNYPVSLSGKTKANVQDYDVGYINVTDTSTRPRRVSELWVNIEWIEAVGGASITGDYLVF